MTGITISIKKEAYDFLKSFKTKGKSFSDVILELKENKYKKGSAKSLLKFAGALKDLNIDWEEKERRMNKFRKDFDKRIEKTIKYMEKSRK
ncbi:antitoxin VapB family protein [Candidatus Woesearchaeota archaeon]|nr:antitoxin VapB family protein [Candidatus Woesearchaeota archaeon]